MRRTETGTNAVDWEKFSKKIVHDFALATKFVRTRVQTDEMVLCVGIVEIVEITQLRKQGNET